MGDLSSLSMVRRPRAHGLHKYSVAGTLGDGMMSVIAWLHQLRFLQHNCWFYSRRGAGRSGSPNDAAKGTSLAKNLEGCTGGGAPAACVDFFDAVLGPPNRFVPARLGLVATERERHIGCVLRQLDMARIHGNGGLAAGAGACHCSELVGAQPLATIVTSGSCIPLLRGKPRVQPSGSLISAISSCQSFSFLAAVQGLEAGLQRTRREATPRTVFRSLTAPPARGYCCCDIAITPTTRL